MLGKVLAFSLIMFLVSSQPAGSAYFGRGQNSSPQFLKFPQGFNSQFSPLLNQQLFGGSQPQGPLRSNFFTVNPTTINIGGPQNFQGNQQGYVPFPYFRNDRTFQNADQVARSNFPNQLQNANVVDVQRAVDGTGSRFKINYRAPQKFCQAGIFVGPNNTFICQDFKVLQDPSAQQPNEPSEFLVSLLEAVKNRQPIGPAPVIPQQIQAQPNFVVSGPAQSQIDAPALKAVQGQTEAPVASVQAQAPAPAAAAPTQAEQGGDVNSLVIIPIGEDSGQKAQPAAGQSTQAVGQTQVAQPAAGQSIQTVQPAAGQSAQAAGQVTQVAQPTAGQSTQVAAQQPQPIQSVQQNPAQAAQSAQSTSSGAAQSVQQAQAQPTSTAKPAQSTQVAQAPAQQPAATVAQQQAASSPVAQASTSSAQSATAVTPSDYSQLTNYQNNPSFVSVDNYARFTFPFQLQNATILSVGTKSNSNGTSYKIVYAGKSNPYEVLAFVRGQSQYPEVSARVLKNPVENAPVQTPAPAQAPAVVAAAAPVQQPVAQATQTASIVKAAPVAQVPVAQVAQPVAQSIQAPVAQTSQTSVNTVTTPINRITQANTSTVIVTPIQTKVVNTTSIAQEQPAAQTSEGSGSSVDQKVIIDIGSSLGGQTQSNGNAAASGQQVVAISDNNYSSSGQASGQNLSQAGQSKNFAPTGQWAQAPGQSMETDERN